MNKSEILKPKQLPLGGDFDLEKQAIINEYFQRLTLHLVKIPFDQEITTTFKTGGYGKVKLLKSAFVVPDHTDENNNYWKLVAPTAVRHPKYNNGWTLGFENNPNPGISEEDKKFIFPIIATDRHDTFEKVKKQEDLDFIKENLHKICSKEIPAQLTSLLQKVSRQTKA
jgi:hypothetical protein